MTTLLTHANQVKAARLTEETTAQVNFDQAANAADAAKADVELSMKALSDKEREITKKRVEWEEAETVPLRDSLAAQLRTLEKQRNQIQKVLLDRRATEKAASEALELATDRTKRAASRKKQAEAWVESATVEDKRRTYLKAAYAALVPVRAAATAFKAQPEVTAARAKLSAVPSKLRAAAVARAAWLEKKISEERGIVEDSEDAADLINATNGGKNGELAAPLRALQRAEWTLAAHVDGLKARLATARATIERLADPDLVLIQAAEATAVGTTLNVTAKNDAADREIALNAQRGVVAELKREVAKQRLIARLDDPSLTGAQVDAVTDVATALSDLDDAIRTPVTGLTARQDAFTLADRGHLSEWQGAISPEAWQGLLDLTTAEAELTAIETAPSTALDAALDTAEADYVTALEEQEAAALASEIGRDAAQDAIIAVEAGVERRAGIFGVFRGNDND